MSDHADIIRAALLAAKDAWFSGRVFDDGQIHVTMSIDEFNDRIGGASPALDALVRELADARAENERLREQVLPGDMVCACLDETGSRTVTVWERCERCHAFMRMPDALAAAQEPPHCTCQSSWPSDLRCPACEAAAQEPPAADEFAGLTDVTRVLPVVAEFVEKHGRLPIDLAEATNGPQPPAEGGDASYRCVCSSHRGTCAKSTCDHPEMWF